MKEKDYYPEGAYNDPNAPWNQVEPEYEYAEVYIDAYCTLKGCVDAPVKINIEDYVEKESWSELRDDWKDVAIECFDLPDLKWHKFKDETPNYGRWIIVKSLFDRNDYTYHCHIFKSLEKLNIDKKTALWQYVNDGYFDIELDDVEFQIP